MNPLLRWTFLLLLGTQAVAQVVPATPRKFTTRKTGSLSEGDGLASLSAPSSSVPAQIKHISYLALGEARQWTSSSGETLVGKLIAWEQLEKVTLAGEKVPTAEMPKFDGKPTVLKEGKLRLLVNQTPYELPLDRLSEDDQAWVKEVVQKLAPAAESKQTEGQDGSGTK